MNWEEELHRLTLEARLLASSPETVFEELKKLSAKTKAQPFWNNWNDKYEIGLVDRNERLINLGLAAYGTNKQVLKALYKHGLRHWYQVIRQAAKFFHLLCCLERLSVSPFGCAITSLNAD